MTQETQSVDIEKEVERELVEDNRAESWKARMREVYTSGDVERIARLLRSVNRLDS